MNKCRNCNNILNKKSQKLFCSKSCSITDTNKRFPRIKKKIRFCIACKSVTRNSHTKFCKKCIAGGWVMTWPNKPTYLRTIKEELELNPAKGANRYNRIRTTLRHHMMKNNTHYKCVRCSYDKHVEFCHIKPISDFPETTLIKNVNKLSNIVVLCPNCHWEFDNGMLFL